MAKQFLKSQGITEIEEIRVDRSPELFAEMQQITGQRSVPQIFIGETHVGGFTDLYALHNQGKLDELLGK
ncbi:glutaredoxin 3 [Neisseria weaveri LMG 5135]|nr:glutaredoxin 3 [Neisseria weaveri LMG 5135]